MGFEYTHNGIRLIDTSRGSYTINPNSSSGEPPQIGKVTAILGHSPDYKSFSIRVPSPTGEISKDIPALTITSSKGIPSIGIGVNTPIGNLDILSSGSTPPNLVLRTNQDGVINVGEETGRVRFLIESSSFNLGGLDLAVSGSTAEIFSRVTSADIGGVKGSLVFGLSATSTTENVDAFSLGYNIAPSILGSNNVHAVLSGSAYFISDIPRLILNRDGQSGNLVELGSLEAGISQHGVLKLKDDIADSFRVVLTTDPLGDSYISGAGNFGIGTTSPQEPLDVRGGYILSSGSGTSHGFGLSRAGFDNYQIRHLDGGLTIYNATDAVKEMTFDGAGNVGIGSSSPGEKLTVTGNISASGNISGSSLHITTTESVKNIIRSKGGFRFVGALGASNEDTSYLDHAGSTTLQWRTNNDSIFELRSQNGAADNVYIHLEHADAPLTNVSIGTNQSLGSFIIARDEGFATNNDFTITGSNGYIGINEPNPTERLSVNGNISASGDLSIQGFPSVSSSLSSLTAATSSYLTSETYTGTVDTSGTPSATQVAIFGDSDTILGDPGLTYNVGTDKLDADGGYTIDGQSFGVYSAGQGMAFGDATNVKNSYNALGHLFTTPISASIVSASDSINTKVYYINDTQVLGQGTQGQLDISDNSFSNLYRGTDHNFITSITSSAEISASGDLYGYDVHAGNNFVLYDNVGVINEVGGTVYFGNTSYPTGYKGTSHNFGTIVYLDTLKASGAITASGGVSASFLEAGTADANGGAYNTVMVDTATGRFYHTGSYGGGGGGGGGGTVTEVTVGTGLDVTNGTTTPNITLDLTEITLSNGLDSTTTGLSLDLTEVIANGTTANLVLTSDGDGTLTAEPALGFDGKLFYPNSGDQAQGNFGTYYDLVDDIEANANTFVGDIAAIGTAITTTAGYVCNLSGSWTAARADSLSTSAGLLGVATVSVSSNEFLLRGYFSVDDSLIQGNPVIGGPIYINAAQAGKYSFAPPSVGNVSRIIGHLVDTWTPDRGINYYYKIYFNPSPEFIET